MDYDWCAAYLELFARDIGIWNKIDLEYAVSSELHNQAHLKTFEREKVARRIMNQLDPGLGNYPEEYDPTDGEYLYWLDVYRRALQAIGLCKDLVNLEIALAPDAPQLGADRMHPGVWAAAEPLWRDGHYRAALHTATIKVNSILQLKSGRTDLSDKRLVEQLFSEDPAVTGSPRLRVAGDEPRTESSTSRQAGARALGLAVFQMIRNPVAHEDAAITEQDAMEKLAMVSQLARLIDDATIRRAS